MSEELRFDGKVAIVTGAGGGLGRAHALLLASRGARVLVNDLGGGMKGGGSSSAMADKVVEEIRAAGGEAAANYDSVIDGHRLVEQAMDVFGGVDIVINNAGILRDVSFHKMTDEDWDLVYKVHVEGSYKVTHAAWPHMREQGYGRIIMTASSSGIYGNFGQANYAMAKLGLVAFGSTLAREGRKRNILVNSIAPVAGSRMTETVMSAEMVEALKPELVSPLVAWLCHERCEETGSLFEVGGGFFAKLRWERSEGRLWRLGRSVSVEDVQDNWESITGFEQSTHPASPIESVQPVLNNIEAGPSKGGNQYIDVDQALGYKWPPRKTSHTEQELALYALSIGAAAERPTDSGALRSVYEMHGDGMVAMPTYAVIPALGMYMDMMKEGQQAPGLNYGLDRVLHGEQEIELFYPLPTRATLEHTASISDIFDKGKGALVVTDVDTVDEHGNPVAHNRITTFVRGAGGWGGDRGSSTPVNVPPERAPDHVVEQVIPRNAALLYRLTGDWNPLHADPDFARNFGFEQPILHGLCTFGYAVRHVVEQCAPDGGDPRYVHKVRARFADSVFPGETIVTEMWRTSDSEIVFQARIKERDSAVITQASVSFYDAIPARPEPPKAAAPADAGEAAAPAEPVGADVMNAVGVYLAANPEVAAKVGLTFQFKLKDPASVWTLDLAAPGGAVSQGAGATPKCTLEMSDADMVAMATGEADAMKLFSTGKLKISGDIMASQKLGFLGKMPRDLIQAEADKRAGSGGGGDAKDAPITTWDIFMGLDAYLQEHPEIAAKVGKVFLFKLTDPDAAWTMDLKAGRVISGDAGNAECTLQLSDANYMAMVQGEADAMKLFSTGKLKISGDIMASQKLTFLQKLDRGDMEKAIAKARAEHGGPAAPADAAPSRPAAAPAIFQALSERLAANPALAEEVGATLRFVLRDPDDTWTARLISRDAFAVDHGAPGEPDTTLTLTDETLEAMTRDEVNLRELFLRGDLRVDGDLGPAQRLGFLKGLL